MGEEEHVVYCIVKEGREDGGERLSLVAESRGFGKVRELHKGDNDDTFKKMMVSIYSFHLFIL